jgi:hypothetical protein
MSANDNSALHAANLDFMFACEVVGIHVHSEAPPLRCDDDFALHAANLEFRFAGGALRIHVHSVKMPSWKSKKLIQWICS